MTWKVSPSPPHPTTSATRGLQKRFVAVAPEEVLDANVLIRILGALLKRRHVRPVLPMLIPEIPGIDAGQNHGGRDATASDSLYIRMAKPSTSGEAERGGESGGDIFPCAD